MREKIKQAYDKVHAQRFVLQVIIIAGWQSRSDQVIQSDLIMANPWRRQQTIPVIGNVVRLTYILNEGASFGHFSGRAHILFGRHGNYARRFERLYGESAQGSSLRWLRVCLSLIFAGCGGQLHRPSVH